MSTKPKINSRSKGKRGELQFRDVLRKHNLTARRGQQFSGGPGSPDVICEELASVHFEVKNTQRGDIYGWMKQAIEDAGGKLPIVVHRRNHKGWVAILDADELLKLLIMREGFQF
jgi:Holliday junction resolvase